METWAWAIASVTLVSLVSLVGVVTLTSKREDQVLLVSVGLAVGAMFGDVFLHLLPESFETIGPMTGIWVLVGLVTFFVLEKFLHWHHEHGHEGHDHPPAIHPLGFLNLAADGLHNLLDGVLVAAAYLSSIEAGIATTIAVILHEIPQEMGDFGVLLLAGFRRRQALFLNLATGALAIVGAGLTLLIGARSAPLAEAMVPFAAGCFIYIAGSDLVPELNKEREVKKSALQLASILFGAGAIGLLKLLE